MHRTVNKERHCPNPVPLSEEIYIQSSCKGLCEPFLVFLSSLSKPEGHLSLPYSTSAHIFHFSFHKNNMKCSLEMFCKCFRSLITGQENKKKMDFSPLNMPKGGKNWEVHKKSGNIEEIREREAIKWGRRSQLRLALTSSILVTNHVKPLKRASTGHLVD